MENHGIKISKTGYDVKTASNDNLVLSSKFPFLLADIVADITLQTFGAGTSTVDITHNYGYVPVFTYAISRFTQQGYLGVTVKANNSVVKCHLVTSFASTFTVKVYIYRNRII